MKDHSGHETPSVRTHDDVALHARIETIPDRFGDWGARAQRIENADDAKAVAAEIALEMETIGNAIASRAELIHPAERAGAARLQEALNDAVACTLARHPAAGLLLRAALVPGATPS